MIPLPPASDVKDIIDTDKPDSVVNAIIRDAYFLARECVSRYEVEHQQRIVVWVAAHLLASTGADGVRASEKLGDASETFVRATLTTNLMGTPYGHQAIMLDAFGCLRRLGNAPASIEPIV